MIKAIPYPPQILGGNEDQKTYHGKNLLQIAMPLGGIGAGCICLNGQGGMQDFSIYNKPSLKAIPDRSRIEQAAFALLHLPEYQLTRLVEGPMPVEKIYDQGLKGQGYLGGRYEGLPCFQESTFKGKYPFGFVHLSDPDIPISVTITGYNPFIPLDDKNSSIPCAILEYAFYNPGNQSICYEFSYHLSHLACGENPRQSANSRNMVVPDTGAYLYNVEHPHSELFGNAALGILAGEPITKAMWFRGHWFDAVTSLWREVSGRTFKPNDGSQSASAIGINGCSVLVKGALQPGEKAVIPVVITWYFPNIHFNIGGENVGQSVKQSCNCQGASTEQVSVPSWRPYYVSQWQDARDILLYVKRNYAELRRRTQDFQHALFNSTLPSYVLEAVSANLDIIKSPTVLRQENGNLWGWEGCSSDTGCCHGSCTHVWNYAQSIPHLFPSLERSLREQELKRSMDTNGHVTFRAALPDGAPPHDFHAAADGQLGGIMKVFREWQISGDKGWLEEMYPLVKKSLDYCIETWDPRHTGLVEEPHHNTYDIEFWGAEGMGSSFYLGALTAATHMAHEVGSPEDGVCYQQLLHKGMKAMDERLFNGEYYQQDIMVDGLRSSPSPDMIRKLYDKNAEEAELFQREGPKFQFGIGCLSDGVLGAWLAYMCGIESPQSSENIKSHLKAVFGYNFRASLRDHVNPQRPGYALGDEPGLLLCSWPRGGKPTLPFVYSDEVWTGIEYQVASHLIANDLVEEGLTIVHAARSRYDGHKRNPWNEYECGSYYARAMSSYALLIALSGFCYSAPQKTLFISPKLPRRPFRCFFSTASGWGTITLEEETIGIKLIEGVLDVRTIILELAGKKQAIPCDVVIGSDEQVFHLA